MQFVRSLRFWRSDGFAVSLMTLADGGFVVVVKVGISSTPQKSECGAQWGMEWKKIDENIASLVKAIKVTFSLGQNVCFEVFFMNPLPSQ